MKVIGIERRAGEYQGKAYCNYMFYCQVEREGRGVLVDTLKVKESVALRIQEDYKKATIFDLVGLEFKMPYYDSFRNVAGLM